MKIFFTGSPRALNTLKEEHIAVYNAIEKSGNQNISDLVINANPDQFYEAEEDQILEHYSKTVRNLKAAELLIAEVSLHSMSMGYLIDKALNMNKPVIALHVSSHPPFFFSGIHDDKLQILEYSTETANETVEDAIKYATEQMDTRFNFFIAPKHQNYLDWISKKKKIPRAVFLRRLIEREMGKDEEYLG